MEASATEPIQRQKSQKLRLALGWFVWAFLSFSAAAIGSLLTTPQIGGWYRELAKPEWTPPSWVFGPVWTLLYLMMATATWLVWRRGGFAGAPIAITLFLVQLLLNTLWSILFFGMENPGASLVDIVLLAISIIATIVAFARHSRAAAWLLVPYLVWVCFATALNFAIWQMNP